jgi:hypothetical protein
MTKVITNQLLVVDWDYFFFNPLEAGDMTHDVFLFDWGHRESPLFIDTMWPIRAASFIRNQLPLPRVNNLWKKFWSRFQFTPHATLEVADSNAYAGLAKPAAPLLSFDHVWLYDAHHDSGYGIKSYQSWARKFVESKGVIDCSDWMLVHQFYGSKLHYRFPKWHKHYLKEGVEVCKGVKLEAKVDSPNTRPTGLFSHAFICRSGAWVPPWCDKEFLKFVNLFPTKRINVINNENLDRNWYESVKLAETYALAERLDWAMRG